MMVSALRLGKTPIRFSFPPRPGSSQRSATLKPGFAEGDGDLLQPWLPETGNMGSRQTTAAEDLKRFAASHQFATILADPPWRFINRTGKMAPEHRRLSRYGTLSVEEIAALPIAQVVEPTAHLYLWVPNALLPEGLQVMKSWGFSYKSNIVWHKLRK